LFEQKGTRDRRKQSNELLSRANPRARIQQGFREEESRDAGGIKNPRIHRSTPARESRTLRINADARAIAMMNHSKSLYGRPTNRSLVRLSEAPLVLEDCSAAGVDTKQEFRFSQIDLVLIFINVHEGVFRGSAQSNKRES